MTDLLVSLFAGLKAATVPYPVANTASPFLPFETVYGGK
jgi:hypothetical protein